MARVSRRMILSATALGMALSALAGTAVAAPETYVSVFGRDVGTCSRLRPCRTFAGALRATDAGGTILALDSGTFSFNYLMITRSVTLAAAPGVRAVLRPATDAGVFVNTGASDVVTLRGLTFVAPAGATTPFNGIVHNPSGALYVEDCTITGFPTKGILVLSHGRLVVRNTLVRGGIVGISLDAAVDAAFENVTVTDAQFGLMASLGAQASIRSSLITGNGVGMLSDAVFETASAELSIDDCLITHNVTGIEVRAHNSIGRLSRSTITNNETGVDVWSAGSLETRGDNTIRGNGTNISGTLTPISGE